MQTETRWAHRYSKHVCSSKMNKIRSKCAAAALYLWWSESNVTQEAKIRPQLKLKTQAGIWGTLLTVGAWLSKMWEPASFSSRQKYTWSDTAVVNVLSRTKRLWTSSVLMSANAPFKGWTPLTSPQGLKESWDTPRGSVNQGTQLQTKTERNEGSLWWKIRLRGGRCRQEMKTCVCV